MAALRREWLRRKNCSRLDLASKTLSRAKLNHQESERTSVRFLFNRAKNFPTRSPTISVHLNAHEFGQSEQGSHSAHSLVAGCPRWIIRGGLGWFSLWRIHSRASDCAPRAMGDFHHCSPLSIARSRSGGSKRSQRHRFSGAWQSGRN